MIFSVISGILLVTVSSATVFPQEDLSNHGFRTPDMDHQITALFDRDGHAGTVSTMENKVNRNPSLRAHVESSRDFLAGYFVKASYSDTTCLDFHTAVGIKLGACLRDMSSYTITTATSALSTTSLNIRRTSFSDSSCKVQIGSPKAFTHAFGGCSHSAQYYLTLTPTFTTSVPGIMIR